MKSASIILVGLFVAQVAVAGALYFNTWSQRAVRPQGSFLALDSTEVDQLSIEGEGESVKLSKEQDAWRLASTGLPADASRVESTIQSISDMQLGWAVASSTASHQQLEVADDKYQRRIKIGSGGSTVGDIFVGTSPGFKRSHVRKEGGDEVYSVAINAYDLPAGLSDWLDKGLLQVDDVSSVSINDKALLKEDDQWVFDGSDNTDQGKAADLVKEFEAMRVTGIFDGSADELEFAKVQLKAADNEYEFGFASWDDDYLVTRQDIDSVFKISQSSYDRVIDADLLLPEPAEDSVPAATEPDAAEPETVESVPVEPAPLEKEASAVNEDAQQPSTAQPDADNNGAATADQPSE